MFSKIMWIAGVGLACGCVVKAVIEIKKEQEEVNTANEKTHDEPISFAEAAKRKVKKFSHKATIWVLNHIQDVQAASMILGIAVPALEIIFSIGRIRNLSKQNAQLDKISKQLDRIELRVGESCGLGYANNFGINTIAYKTDAINLPKEVLSMLHDETLKLMD